MIVALFLHVLADVVWVGGMFLAYMVVRPAAAEALEPSQRLKLWNGIFRRFFPWVWTAVVLLLATGFIMMDMMDRVPPYVIVMTLIGIVMAAIFVYLYFVPFAQLLHIVRGEHKRRAYGRVRYRRNRRLREGVADAESGRQVEHHADHRQGQQHRRRA